MIRPFQKDASLAGREKALYPTALLTVPWVEIQ